MPTLNKLIDNARKVCERESDNALALHMGVSRSAISVWRKSGKISDEHLATLIQLAQADPALAVAVRQEAATTPDERKLWGPLWDRLSPAVSTVGVILAIALQTRKTADVSRLKSGFAVDGRSRTRLDRVSIASAALMGR